MTATVREPARDLPVFGDYDVVVVGGGPGNLLVAGRCASMTHEGQSAARASGACFAMGQAAGTAAARLGAGAFGELDVQALRRLLQADGAQLEA